MPYVDAEREYDEIAVLEATLKAPKNASRIAEVIHRTIPYPLVLVLRSESRELLSLAPKRFSRSEKGATVAEEFASSGWLDSSSPSESQEQFIASIALSNLPQANYHIMYSALMNRVVTLRSSCRTGEYHVLGDRDRIERQRRLLAEADEIEVQVNECRSAIKKEHQFNHKVELNTRMKQLEGRLVEVLDELKTSENGA